MIIRGIIFSAPGFKILLYQLVFYSYCFFIDTCCLATAGRNEGDPQLNLHHHLFSSSVDL